MENTNSNWVIEHNFACKEIDVKEKAYDDITANVLNVIAKKTIPSHGTEYGTAYDVVASATTSGTMYEYRIENKSRNIYNSNQFRAGIRLSKLRHIEKTQQLVKFSHNDKVKYLFFYYEFINNKLILYVFDLNNIKNIIENSKKIEIMNKYTQLQEKNDFKVKEKICLFDMSTALFSMDLTNNQYIKSRLVQEEKEINQLKNAKKQCQ